MIKRHQISLDFSKPRGGGTAAGYMIPAPSVSSLTSRTAPPSGFGSKTSKLGSNTPSASKMKVVGRHTVATVPAGMSDGDKTVCQFCGVSYLAIAEMRALKAQVKDQSERLLHYKELTSENAHLKETMGNLRQTHHKEQMKYESELQWLKGHRRELENQVESLQGKSLKYDLATTLIHEKMSVLETAIRKIVLNPQLKDRPETDMLITRLEEVNRIIAQGRSTGDGPTASVETSGNDRQTDVKRDIPARCTGTAIAKKVSSLNAVEIHDLRRENNSLVEKIRNLAVENANCLEMHSNLRETLDKLKNDNAHLHEDMNALRVQYDETTVANENLEAQLKGQRTENDRVRSFAKELEFRLRGAEEQNRNLKNSVDPSLVERLQTSLTGLKKQIQEHHLQSEKIQEEFQTQLANAQRETAMEKERADSCLAASLLERQDIERRWDERWGRHQASLNEQLDELRSNYEKTLVSVRAHEESLQKEVSSLRDKLEKAKETWESNRKSLVDQVSNWKVKYEQKQKELEAASKSKVDVELLYQEKSAEMETLHEIIREGCEERQDLQRQVSAMKENFEEVRLQGQSCYPPNRIQAQAQASLRGASLDGNYCCLAQLKEKQQHQLQQAQLKSADVLVALASGCTAPPCTSDETMVSNFLTNDVYLPPPTAPSTTQPRASIRPTAGISNLYKEKVVPSLDAFPFTIGRGKRTTPKPSTPTVTKPAMHHGSSKTTLKRRAQIQAKPLRKRGT